MCLARADFKLTTLYIAGFSGYEYRGKASSASILQGHKIKSDSMKRWQFSIDTRLRRAQ